MPPCDPPRRRSQLCICRDQLFSHLFGPQVFAVHLVESRESPATDRRVRVVEPFRHARGIADLDEGVRERMLRDAVGLLAELLQQGGHVRSKTGAAKRFSSDATFCYRLAE